MNDHKDLDVWKKSMDIVVDIYGITKDFPKDEIYGLTSQIRRAAVSIPSNIAEGAARNTDKEFMQFLYISLGSASEVETQLLLAQRLQFSGNIAEIISKLMAVKQMINGLIRHYKNKCSVGRDSGTGTRNS
jgi:four helix bundle protein